MNLECVVGLLDGHHYQNAVRTSEEEEKRIWIERLCCGLHIMRQDATTI